MNKNLRSSLVRLAIISLGTYLTVCLYMFFNQKNYLYFPDNQDFDSCPGFADSAKVRIGGTRMYYLAAEEAQTILVFYHGNAGSACDRAFIKDNLKNHGLALLFVEYTGYSNDNRQPTRELILQDAKNASQFISTLPYEKIVLLGSSLGSAVAAYHQTLQRPEKIILLAPFDKLSRLGKIHYPFLPVSLLLREEYDSIAWLKNYTGEIMIIHGTADEIVPWRLAKNLYNQILSNNKKFITIAGANHNNLFDHPQVWQELIDYLK